MQTVITVGNWSTIEEGTLERLLSKYYDSCTMIMSSAEAYVNSLQILLRSGISSFRVGQLHPDSLSLDENRLSQRLLCSVLNKYRVYRIIISLDLNLTHTQVCIDILFLSPVKTIFDQLSYFNID